MQYKLRPIVRSQNKVIFGLTVPEDIAIFFRGCYFTVEKCGTSIIFYSGTSLIPTKQEVEEYKFEDCKCLT